MAHRGGTVVTLAPTDAVRADEFPTVVVAPPEPGPPGYDKAWWGMLVVVTTEGMIFLVLLAANFFLRATSRHWPPAGVELPELAQTSIFTAILLGSSLPIFWVDAAVKRGRMRQVQLGLALSWVMGTAFLVHTLLDFEALHFGWRDSAYGSVYYTIIGLHALHVLVGLLFSAVVQLKVALGRIDGRRHVTLDVFSLYWHFVDVVWILVFSSLILSVHVR
jgi:heme/copper-type cytochrome/quinol oxidase subunit 3